MKSWVKKQFRDYRIFFVSSQRIFVVQIIATTFFFILVIELLIGFEINAFLVSLFKMYMLDIFMIWMLGGYRKIKSMVDKSLHEELEL